MSNYRMSIHIGTFNLSHSIAYITHMIDLEGEILPKLKGYKLCMVKAVKEGSTESYNVVSHAQGKPTESNDNSHLF